MIRTGKSRTIEITNVGLFGKFPEIVFGGSPLIHHLGKWMSNPRHSFLDGSPDLRHKGVAVHWHEVLPNQLFSGGQSPRAFLNGRPDSMCPGFYPVVPAGAC